MNIRKLLLSISAAIVACGALAPTHARAQVSVSFFYNTLDPYGEWVQDPDYGYVWHPTNVDENWAPYTDGYWAYTDQGWTWVSYEDYGGVVYHYGRWAHLPGEGWVWVPGTTWAPAWVSWRSNDDYVGWAPLPPEAHWSVDVGFSGWVDSRFDIGPGFYSFVGVRDFGAPALGPVIINREQNVTIINNTRNITNITNYNSTVYTGGPSYQNIAARSARPIPTLKLVRQGDPSAIRAANGKVLSRQQGNSLYVLSPKVTAPEGGRLPAPPHVARSLTGVKADHGWNVVKDPSQREQMESKFKAQAGTNYAAARPVNEADIRAVNEHIKNHPANKSFVAGEGTQPVTKGKTRGTDLNALENATATEQPGEPTDNMSKTGKTKKSHAEGVYGNGATDKASTATDSLEKPGKTKKSRAEGVYGNGATDQAGTPTDSLEKPGKTKKGHASEDTYGGADAATGEVPKKKGKKSKTPAYDEGAYGDTEKHAKGDSNLQPFMSGGESGAKPKKFDAESDYKPSKKSYDEAGASDYKPSKKSAGEPDAYAKPKGGDIYGAQPRKPSEKGEKGDKKKKSDGDYPPGQ